jgi:hypothetical protein
MTTAHWGTTPYIIGLDPKQILVPAGTRVQILETCAGWTVVKTPAGKATVCDCRKPYYKVRIAGTTPGTFWVLWIGSESYPVPGVLKED